MPLSSSYPRKYTPIPGLRKLPFQALLHWSSQGWITATALCWGCQVWHGTAFNLCRTRQQGLWHWQRRENTSSLSWKTSTGFLWSIVSTARFFHWRTTASEAQLYNIFKNWFLAIYHHWSSSKSCPLCSSCGWKPHQKVVWLQGFLQLWPHTLECPPSGAGRIWVFFSFSRETRDSLVFRTSDCTLIHLLSFSLFIFFVVVACLSCPGKETAPVCIMSMTFLWRFGRSTTWQSSSSSSGGHSLFFCFFC